MGSLSVPESDAHIIAQTVWLDIGRPYHWLPSALWPPVTGGHTTSWLSKYRPCLVLACDQGIGSTGTVIRKSFLYVNFPC